MTKANWMTLSAILLFVTTASCRLRKNHGSQRSDQIDVVGATTLANLTRPLPVIRVGGKPLRLSGSTTTQRHRQKDLPKTQNDEYETGSETATTAQAIDDVVTEGLTPRDLSAEVGRGLTIDAGTPQTSTSLVDTNLASTRARLVIAPKNALPAEISAALANDTNEKLVPGKSFALQIGEQHFLATVISISSDEISLLVFRAPKPASMVHGLPIFARDVINLGPMAKTTADRFRLENAPRLIYREVSAEHRDAALIAVRAQARLAQLGLAGKVYAIWGDTEGRLHVLEERVAGEPFVQRLSEKASLEEQRHVIDLMETSARLGVVSKNLTIGQLIVDRNGRLLVQDLDDAKLDVAFHDAAAANFGIFGDSLGGRGTLELDMPLVAKQMFGYLSDSTMRVGPWQLSHEKLAIDLDQVATKIDSGTPVLRFENLALDIPPDIMAQLNQEQLAELTAACLNDYAVSVAKVEDLLPPLILRNQKVVEFVQRASHRLLTFLTTYAEILARQEGKNPQLRLYQVLADSFHDAAKKSVYYAGNIGANPLALMKVMQQGNVREQMYLLLSIYKTVMPIIAQNPALESQIAQKIKDDEGWDFRVSGYPLADGLYSLQTDPPYQNLREPTNQAERHLATAPTIADVDLTVPLSTREKRYFARDPVLTAENSNVRLQWLSGSVVFRPRRLSEQPNNAYIMVTDDLRAPVFAGISGTTDYVMTSMYALGLNTLRELYFARLAAAGWLIDGKSHTGIEVLQAAAAFGMEFVARPGFYRDLDKYTGTGVTAAVDAALRERGLLPPDDYLRGAYVRQKYEDLLARRRWP